MSQTILRLASRSGHCLMPQGMYELCTEHGSDIFRMFFFHGHHTVLVLTNGYQKKSPKMNTHEFERAKRYRDDWVQRGGL